MSGKKWLTVFLIIIITGILISAVSIIIIDPYFHFHAPLSSVAYTYDRTDERYVNNGIVKNFDYDAIITGTSHTENFKVSEFNNLFNCNAVKVPLEAAEFKEISEQMSVAINHNNNLNMILYGITYEDLLNDKDAVKYEDYPTYLYDENIYNDYKYIFSGSTFKRAGKYVILTLTDYQATNFDDYGFFKKGAECSKEIVLSAYERPENKIPVKSLNEEERNRVIDNINQNIVDNIESNKDITFCLFLSPHSIVWWDEISQNGETLKYLEAEEILINSLLEFDNVKLYSFFNDYDLICNLDNYKDKVHYSDDVYPQILQWIKNDEYLLTKENVDEYLTQESQFYLNYNYDEIFVGHL